MFALHAVMLAANVAYSRQVLEGGCAAIIQLPEEANRDAVREWRGDVGDTWCTAHMRSPIRCRLFPEQTYVKTSKSAFNADVGSERDELIVPRDS